MPSLGPVTYEMMGSVAAVDADGDDAGLEALCSNVDAARKYVVSST
jgi:hypothetical protein